MKVISLWSGQVHKLYNIFHKQTFQNLEFKCHLCKTHSYFLKQPVSLLFYRRGKKLLMGLASRSSPMSNTLVRIAYHFQKEILLKNNKIKDVLIICWQDINFDGRPTQEGFDKIVGYCIIVHISRYDQDCLYENLGLLDQELFVCTTI